VALPFYHFPALRRFAIRGGTLMSIPGDASFTGGPVLTEYPRGWDRGTPVTDRCWP
jgi:hypothetical protein